MDKEIILDKELFSIVWKESCKRRRKTEQKWIQIWEKDCDGRCSILHLERCPRYEDGECKFPETAKAKEIVEGGKRNND